MIDHCLALTLASLDHADILWIVDENMPPETLASIAPDAARVIMTNRYDIADQLQRRGCQVVLSDFDFNALPDQPRRFSRIVYRISKEKSVVHHCINHAMRHLAEGGELLLIGGKQDGIKSIGKNAGAAFGCRNAIKKVATAYRVTLPAVAELPDDAWLPDNDYAELRQVQHGNMTFYSKPGVFGWDKIDKGSVLLVGVLPKVFGDMKGATSVLDLGCGWGYLMLATRDMDIARRVAVDNNMAAVAAARRNFSDAGLTVETLADDAGSQLRERFDLLLCNPPFHQGFAVSERLTRHFLAAAARVSRRSTRAIFVVNQFIPLERLAPEYFGNCRLLAEGSGFNVFELRPGSRHPHD